jgi:hypothetical protein
MRPLYVAAFHLPDVVPQKRRQQMFTPSVAVGKPMLRALIVYAFVFALLRLVGKRHVGQMAPFDLIVLLLISEK